MGANRVTSTPWHNRNAIFARVSHRSKLRGVLPPWSSSCLASEGAGWLQPKELSRAPGSQRVHSTQPFIKLD